MKEPVKVTLIQLRDYLLTKRPDDGIDMSTGGNVGVGCLMTQYGRDHEFLFGYSNASAQKWTGHVDNGSYVEAVLDGYVFDIFYRPGDPEYVAAKEIASRYSSFTCGYWMDMVKDKPNK